MLHRQHLDHWVKHREQDHIDLVSLVIYLSYKPVDLQFRSNSTCEFLMGTGIQTGPN
jgi:hypothetical protein